MKAAVCSLLLVVACCGACVGVGGEQGRKILVYRGASDVSAAVAVGEDMFVVADDENNILRVYKTASGGLPVYSYDMSDFLRTERDHPEADIEGATRVGDRVYWITSHGRNKDGKFRSNRYRFFATEIKVRDGNVTIRPVGRPCTTLVQGLLRAATLRNLGLAEAAGAGARLSKKELKALAPKKEGLNIEGLCASVDGRTLYIGFRNPRPVDKSTGRAQALVVPLLNGAGVIDKSERPVFGEPLLWDLGGLGIRSMEYGASHKAYFIVAGSFDGDPVFALYRWSGKRAEQPSLVRQLSHSNFGPEALIPFEGSEKFLLLSDDGTLPVRVSDESECMEGELLANGTCPNKFLLDSNRKTFRAIWLKP
ncbi:MAG: DUF3616 domain-containing protein [Planctomycetes bacterium]|nr:DUF3616 domain-containing protein [Planctomycetota bacterium]